jgi:hypothetical protein
MLVDLQTWFCLFHRRALGVAIRCDHAVKLELAGA